MQSLEEKVRDAIVERKIKQISAKLQEARSQAMYQQMFTEIVEELYQQFKGTMPGIKRLTREELIEFTAPHVTPKEIKKRIEIIVKDSYMFSQELEKALQDIDPQIYGIIRKSIPYLRKNVQSQTQILRELTSIAQTKGVAYAATQEAEDQAMQRVFATGQEYTNFVNFGYEVRQEVSAIVQELEINRIAGEINANIPENTKQYIATIISLTIKHLYTFLRKIDKQCAFERIPVMYGD